MEKLKNLVNPGSKKDDEVMYGSGRSDDPVHDGGANMGNANTGSGQGSHFGSSRTAAHDPLSTSVNPTGTSQYDRGTTAGTSQYDSSTGGASHGLSEPYASRMPGGFDDDDAATTASVSSGVPGQSQSRSAMTGVNDPVFTDKPLPREPVSETGFGKSSLTGNSYPDRSIRNSTRDGDHSDSSHLSRDAALEAGVVGTSAHRHEDQQQDNYAPETGRSFPLGGSSASDNHGPTTADLHTSNYANRADSRFNSDGSRIAGNTGYGSTSGGYGSGTGATPSSNPKGSLGRDTLGVGAGPGAMESGTVTGTGYGPESWQHEHQHHGHQYEGDPCESGEVGGQEGPHFVSGPHATDTANRLDPHVGSGIGGADAAGGPSGRHHHGHHGHRGEEAALAGGAGAAGLGALEANRSQQGTTGNTTSSGLGPSNTDRHGLDTTGGGTYDNDRGTTTGASSTGKTAGPHTSDMLNKLDPRVDSDLSKQQGHHGGDHHYGRDAALTGAGGAGLYEAEKHHRDNEPNLAASSTTSGMGAQSPFGSGHDPRANPTRSGVARDQSAVSSAGSGHQPATTSDHHYKRNAGLAGAGGIGAYEAEKHLGSSNNSDLATTPQDRLAGSGHQPAIAASSSPYPSSDYGTGSQPQAEYPTERDRLAAGGGGPAYPSPGYGNDTENGHDAGRHIVRDAALVGGAGAGAGALAGHEYSQRDAAGHGTEVYQDISQGHNTGRDAAAVGETQAGAGAGYGREPYQETSHKHHTGRDIAAVGGAGAGAGALADHQYSQRDTAGYGTEPYQDTSLEHHTGRDAAVLGGAAGAGGLAGHEYSKKDAEKSQREHVKEEKALEKEHLKEVKHHNKEVAKEEKAHEKAIEKSEKKHEKAMEKDEKKHGGLLGFLHRDKPDKELKEEEARGQTITHPGHGEEEMAAGAGATGLAGSQSGFPDTPIGIGSGPTTHDAYGAHDSGHNKLHKDPPAKVRESRGYDIQ